MNTLRNLTNSGEHMNYLLDNGYTEDAKRLFESQFSEGDAYRRQGNKWNTDLLYRPFAWRAGFNHGNDPVDQYLSLYFQEDARDQSEYGVNEWQYRNPAACAAQIDEYNEAFETAAIERHDDIH